MRCCEAIMLVNFDNSVLKFEGSANNSHRSRAESQPDYPKELTMGTERSNINLLCSKQSGNIGAR